MFGDARVWLCVLALGLATGRDAASADEPASEPRGARRLLSLPTRSLPDEEAIRAVAEDAFAISASRDERLQFDVVLRGKAKDPADGAAFTMRTLAEKNAGVASASLRNEIGWPVALYRDSHVFWLDEEGAWRHLAPGRWGYSIDEQRLGVEFRAVSGFDSEVAFDLTGLLKNVLQGKSCETRWDAGSRSLTLQKPNGTVVTLRLRSPDDQRRYGGVWSELTMRGAASELLARGFVARAADVFAVETSNDELKRVLDSRESRERPTRFGPSRLESSQPFRAALAMDAALGGAAYRRPASEALRRRLREVLAMASAVQAAAAKQAGAEEDRVNERVDETLLAAACAKALVDLADGVAADSEGFPDDPVMIWREAEARCGAGLLGFFLHELVVPVLNHPPILAGVRTELADALGDLGSPSAARTEPDLAAVRRDPLVDAVLRAHWQEACDDAHVQICQAALAAAREGSKAEAAAFEALVRMDAYPDAPAAADRWWRSEAVDVARPRRVRTLALLTSTASGREALMSRLRSGEPSEEVRRDAADALRARIDAVERTERWDFIDRERCASWRRELDALAPPAR